jgi:VWFA-related protein
VALSHDASPLKRRARYHGRVATDHVTSTMRARVLAFLFVAGTVTAQEPDRPPAGTPQFATGTSAVVMDVVVRDRQGRPVTDLQKADFELVEDGTRQTIADLTLVLAPQAEAGARATAAAATTAASPSPTPPAGATAPSFVALVFDRLSPEGRASATKGARTALTAVGGTEFFGVFVNDQSLRTLQTFTTDKAKVEAAIATAATTATASFRREDGVSMSGRGDSHAATSYTASAEFAGRALGTARPTGAQGTDAGVISEQALTRMVRRAETTFELLSRDHQGFSTTNGLMALIAALAPLPGRKSIVFFAETLAIPVAVQARFESVIENANRVNVAIYAIDAAGLRVQSDQAAVGRELRCLAGEMAGGTCEEVAGLLGLGYDLADLRVDALRKDPATALATLSRATGGFLVNNTNDLGRAFAQIDLDRRFHYLLTYSPTNQQFDGQWRKVSVKVPGRSVTVRARSGYAAIRAPGALPFLRHEAAALAALDRQPRPTAIPIQARAFVFPGVGDARIAVLASTPAGAVTFRSDDRARTFGTDFTILARIRDADGEVVRKASEVYRLSGPASGRDAARAGDVLFFRQPTLPPGRYTLEAVVHDALGGTSGVETQTFDVPAATTLGVGSLVVVARTEPAGDAKTRGDNPLYAGDVLVYPNLGAPIRMADGAITLMATVVAPEGTALSGRLQVLKDGTAAMSGPVTFGAPVNGRIQQVWRVPIAALAPGSHTIRLDVSDGRATAVRETTIALVDAP